MAYIPPSQGVTLQSVWKFDDSTTASDPGGGKFRFDNSDQTIITNIYIDDENEEGNDFGNLINALSTSDLIYIQELEDRRRSVLVNVSGVVTDNTGWWTIPITFSSGAERKIRDGKECGFIFHYV